MPAAEVTACCSAMPTSNTRSGWASAIGARPTGFCMAAVMATTSGRSSAIATISSPNTEVQDWAVDEVMGSPVEGSITPIAWNWSASCATAGA